MTRIARGFAAAALLVLLAAPVTAGAKNEVRMTVQVGMGSTVRGGAWTPVFVDLENPGPAIQGAVVVRFDEQGMQKGASREKVELATGAKKRVVVYARPRSGPGSVDVTFEDARERVLAGPEEVAVQAVDDDTILVGLLNMGSRGDPGMRPLVTAKTRVAVMDPEELPEAWAALEALDALVIRDPDTSKLGPKRIEALKAWVAAGGVLAVSTGEKWRTMDDPAFAEMLPVRLQGVKTVSAADLPLPFSEHGGDLAMAVSSPLRGSVRLTGPDGEPLVADARYGLGRVVFLAVDPGDLQGAPVESKGRLWRATLQLAPEPIEDPNAYGGGGYYGYNSPSQYIQQELSRIPPLRPPSVLLVTALIGLYVLVVGPGDYFILKRMGKLHWTWVTYPTAIAVFSGLIYMYARLTRSSDMMVRTLTVVDAPAEPPTAPSPARVFGGVYSPRAGRYKVNIKAPIGALAGSFSERDPYGGVSAKGEYLTTGGNKPSILLSIPIWSMAGVEFSTVMDEPPPFLVEPLADGSVRITNTGEAPLEYVGLMIDRQVVDGGKLEPGKDVKLSRFDPGRVVTDLPNEMSQAQYGGGLDKTRQDIGRVVRVFAYATDPPTQEDDGTTVYYAPKRTRHRSGLERPRGDRGTPMVVAVTRAKEPMIAVADETVAGDGLVIWRRPATRAR